MKRATGSRQPIWKRSSDLSTAAAFCYRAGAGMQTQDALPLLLTVTGIQNQMKAQRCASLQLTNKVS